MGGTKEKRASQLVRSGMLDPMSERATGRAPSTARWMVAAFLGLAETCVVGNVAAQDTTGNDVVIAETPSSPIALAIKDPFPRQRATGRHFEEQSGGREGRRQTRKERHRRRVMQEVPRPNPDPLLTTDEISGALASLETSRPHQGRPSSTPIVMRDGAVRFMFGAQHPSIITSPGQVTDVALQPGEHVSSVTLGDCSNWMVDPAVSGGAGGEEVQHVLIRALEPGQETSLVVTTDRRTYHLRLKSDRRRSMPSVLFGYPEDAQALQALQAPRPRTRELVSSRSGLAGVNFGYRIQGDDVPWKPLRVYNDAHQTILDLQTDAWEDDEPPVLLILQGMDGGDNSDVVGYRVEASRLVVDGVFAEAALVTGSGEHQQVVWLTRNDLDQP